MRCTETAVQMPSSPTAQSASTPSREVGVSLGGWTVTTAQLQAGGYSPAEGREPQEAPRPCKPEHPLPSIIIKPNEGSLPCWWGGCDFTLLWSGNSTPTPK